MADQQLVPPTLDYDALAQQAGAVRSTRPPVDYDQLAQQARALFSAPSNLNTFVGPPAPPESWTHWGLRHGKEALETFDPHSPGGRRNLASGVGAALGTAAVVGTAPVSMPVLGLSAATAGVLGAIGGGMTAEAGEQLAGTKPPSGTAALTAGGEQGLYEASGHLLLWPARVVGRRLVAGRVGRYAAEALSTAKTQTLSRLQSALDSAQSLLRGTKATATEANVRAATSTRQMVSEAAGLAREGVQAASTLGAAQEETGRGLAAQGVTTAQTAATVGEAVARAPYEQIVGAPPPSATRAGRLANQAIQEGAPARARNIAGRAVDAAADSGPDVDITALQQEAQRIVEQKLRPPAEAFPRRAPEAAGDEALTAATGIPTGDLARMRRAPPGSTPAANLADLQAAIEAAQGEAEKETLKHPAMGVISRILNADSTVSFKAVHLWKVELENAIRGTRDKAVRSQVASLTQHLSGGLRQALRAMNHAPYEQATAAYAKIAPLYTQGIAPRLRKLAQEEPEAVVRLLNPKQPTRARMLVDLLTTQAAEGGDEAGGRRALEAVQAVWVHQKVIQGGIEKLGLRIDAIPLEFRRAFLGGPKATQVLDNLKLIHTAYKTAVLTGEQGVEAATQAGKAGVAALGELGAQRTTVARETGRQALGATRELGEGVRASTRQAGAQRVEQAAAQLLPARRALREGARTAREAEQALATSSLGPTLQRGAVEHAAADVLRAAALGPRSVWGGLSIVRLLHGPTANDLVRWAAFSPTGTRAFVRAITSPTPSLALADLVRSSGILGGAMQAIQPVASHDQRTAPVGTPPPR